MGINPNTSEINPNAYCFGRPGPGPTTGDEIANGDPPEPPNSGARPRP